MEEPWQHAVAKLSLAGQTDMAIALLHSEIERGSLAALVSLARRYHDARLSNDQAVKLIARAERDMAKDDVDVHLELAKAYDQRIGDIPYEEMARRSLQHIECAAELGAGHAHCLAAARIWHTGTLGVEPDRSKAAKWYRLAEDQGSSEAAAERHAHGL